MRIEGHIAIGEANRWASQAAAPLNGDNRLNNALGFGLGLTAVLVGMSAASLAAEALGEGWVYLPVLLATAGPLLVVLVRWLQARFVRRYRRNLMARGVVDPLPSALSVESDGLCIRLGAVEKRASWSAVSDIFPVGPYWVLLIQGAATFVPKRHFTEAGQEGAFVRAVLDRLTPEARERSGEARAFVAV